MKIEKKKGFVLCLIILLAVSGPLFSQERPSQIYSPHNRVSGLSFGKSLNSHGLQHFPGSYQQPQFLPQLNSFKIAPPVIRWKAASRWRSIQEIYILKHRVYNELIQNMKRLNLA